MKLLTREQVLALDLPVERKFNRVVYRYATETDADNHLKEEARALQERKRP